MNTIAARYASLAAAFDAAHDAAEDAYDSGDIATYKVSVKVGRIAFDRFEAVKAELLADRAARSAAQVAGMSSKEITRALALADRLFAKFKAEDDARDSWESASECRQILETMHALGAHRQTLIIAFYNALEREEYEAAKSETLRSLVGRVAA